MKRPTTLMVVPGEMHPTTRKVDEEVEATEMTGVEHLGQYVYEMTQAKIKQLEAGTLALPPIEEAIVEEEQEVDEVTGEEFDQQEESEI